MRIAYCKCSVAVANTVLGPNGGWMVKDYKEGETCDQCNEPVVVVDGDPTTMEQEDGSILMRRMFVTDTPNPDLPAPPQNWTQN